jgi:hypothetical protein
MVSGSSLTPGTNLQGLWCYVFLQIPTMTGGFGADTQIIVRGSADGITYYRYAIPGVGTSTVASPDFAVASSTTQKIVQIPGFALPFIQLETTAVATAGVSSNNPFKFICVSNQ